MKTTLKARELQLADTVRLADFGGAWSTAIVKNITDNAVTLFRPYGTSADFSYTGGVITYVGIEEYTVLLDSESTTFELLDRKELK